MNIQDLKEKGKWAFGGMIEKGKELSDEIPVLLEKGSIIPKEKMKEFEEKYGESLTEAIVSGKGTINKLLEKLRNKKAE
jgi:hypothetical protein